MSKKKTKRTQWFTDARFGMFIHWGLYAMPARHEWIRNRERISKEDYQIYFDLFDPDLFNPKEWAAAAKAAGMKYVVVTSKHHEGFCLWDSRYTDYKATNTPAKRDLLREIVDAFRAEGLKIGFYYSLLDWHHPDFTVDRYSPERDAPNKAELNEGRDMRRYAQYMRDQVTELLTEYGTIDIMWFDFSYPGEDGKGHEDWESEKLIELVRKLQPEIIVNNRLDLPYEPDVTTPEQFTPSEPIKDSDGNVAVWEGCQTFSGSWGYHRDESTWKAPRVCVEMLINHVSRGGNLLMNVGPTGRGFLDARALQCLDGYAQWMKYCDRSIYGCGVAPFEEAKNCRYTYNPETNRLYVHVLSWSPADLHLPGLAGKVRYAQLLHDGSQLSFHEKTQGYGTYAITSDSCTIHLPIIQPDILIPVVEIILK
jgi:alpha-L-fucosidase